MLGSYQYFNKTDIFNNVDENVNKVSVWISHCMKK